MDRHGIFAGDDPFAIARAWLAAAEAVEPNDPNAIALATVDSAGLPNVRMVLLKEIESGAFVFYTNYGSAKALDLNMKLEFRRNAERYQFMKWGMQAFDTFGVVPPGFGIVHQVNLEYLARGVHKGKDGVTYPDTLVGTAKKARRPTPITPAAA